MIDPIRRTADAVDRLVDTVMEEATAAASVLIVERDAALRERMVERVRGQGYRVEGAEELQAAVYLADEMAPDAVVVSLGAGGWEPEWALRVFRVLDMTARVPIVAVASGDVPPDALAGYDGVIPRSFARYRVGSQVTRVLALAAERSE